MNADHCRLMAKIHYRIAAEIAEATRKVRFGSDDYWRLLEQRNEFYMAGQKWEQEIPKVKS